MTDTPTTAAPDWNDASVTYRQGWEAGYAAARVDAEAEARTEPRAEGLDYGPLMTAVSILLSVTAAIMPESAPCHHDRGWLMGVLDDVRREYAALEDKP